MRSRLFSFASLGSILVASALSCDDSPLPGPAPSPGTPTRYSDVPESGTKEVAGLEGKVDVVRDRYGMVHIAATSIADAMRVQGYQVARDRTAQLELIRRSATGRLAEAFGDASPALIDSDITMRTIGLARTARKMVELLTPAQKSWIDAYADGISQFNARIQTGDEEMPPGMVGLLPAAFAPWTAEDVLAVGRLQAFNLGYTADEEIAQTEFIEIARAKLEASDPDPKVAKRAGLLVDLVRFAPLDAAMPLTGFPNDPQGTMKQVGSSGTPRSMTPAGAGPLASPKISLEAIAATRAYRLAAKAARGIVGDKELGMTGSNNWVVAPSKSATGHALLASDPHLSLSAPAVFWMVHVSVDAAKEEDKLDFAGLSFPGLPGIILGFNQNVAWGATTADYDVTDVYQETLTGDASAVVYNGASVPIQKVHETIVVKGGAPVEYDVLVVPHHGPIVPTITPSHTVAPPAGGAKVLSIKWTGHQATKDLDAVFGLLRAKNVDDARTALKSFAIGAQNWVVADTGGNIFYTTQSIIPKRNKAAYTWDPATFTGTIPCFVLPGDGSAEWTGTNLEDAFIPHAKNPQKGYLATANTDQIGVTLDNDPTNDKLPSGEAMYMGAWHDVGFRLARIQKRIEAKSAPLTLDDLASIQGDAQSAAGMKLTPQIESAIAHAAAETATPGTHPGLTALVASDRWKSAPIREVSGLFSAWRIETDFTAESGMNPDDNRPVADGKEATSSVATSIFNAWVIAMFRNTLHDEIAFLDPTNESFPFEARRPLVDLMVADKKTLKTYDATLDDSILFDDITTPAVETRDERILTSLLDAIDFLKKRLGNDMQQWRWGRMHAIRFTSLVSFWGGLSIPASTDTTFPLGFPRHGDGWNVDVAGFGMARALDDTTSFTYAHGPTQRFVIDMDPAGPVAKNVLPGGNVWHALDPHFRDEAERWRRNQNRPVPFAAKAVVAEAEGRVVFSSAANPAGKTP